TAMIFAELYRHNSEWKFRAVGQGYAGGLKALANGYGLTVN
ncbi:TerD family protein, partial [Pseudomonas aeruginosa]|nr:TerD family protein [Pseudomonas aeruginosa]MCR7790745.1 TerD family protein [Pseudomonas aeruginosa]MCR7907525.1 TerD family protein [Pseudomonas aeruginosa]MCR8427594.1 TerD family protein [Pseudomonas aeruginosa]